VGLKQRLSDGVLVHRLDGVMEAADVDELHGGGEGVVEVAEEGVLIHEKVHDSERWDQMGSWLATMMVCERGTRDGVDGDAGESSISLEVGHHVWPAAMLGPPRAGGQVQEVVVGAGHHGRLVLART
jgi:hypothetical protein